MAQSGDLELASKTESVQDESEVPPCKLCKYIRTTNTEDLPLGVVQDCINCWLLLDAIESWNETVNLQLVKCFNYLDISSSKIWDRSCIELQTVDPPLGVICLRVSPDASRASELNSHNQTDLTYAMGFDVIPYPKLFEKRSKHALSLEWNIFGLMRYVSHIHHHLRLIAETIEVSFKTISEIGNESRLQLQMSIVMPISRSRQLDPKTVEKDASGRHPPVPLRGRFERYQA